MAITRDWHVTRKRFKQIHVAGFGAMFDSGWDRGPEERLESKSQHAVSYSDRWGPREILSFPDIERSVQKRKEISWWHGDRNRRLAGPSRIFATEGLYRGSRGIPDIKVWQKIKLTNNNNCNWNDEIHSQCRNVSDQRWFMWVRIVLSRTQWRKRRRFRHKLEFWLDPEDRPILSGKD